MTELDEFFAVLTEDPEGPLALDGHRYEFASVAVRNPEPDSQELRQLLELAHEHVLQDGRKRILVRYRGKRFKTPMEDVELISTVPIGPVQDVLRKF